MRPLPILALLLFVALALPGFAQDSDQSPDDSPEVELPNPDESTPENPRIVSTLTLGGLVTGVSSYALVEYGWFRHRLGYMGEIYSEFTFRNWPDGTSDRFLYMGGSVGVRGSVLPGGRGLFGELSVGGGGAWLVTLDGGERRADAGFNIALIPRAGIRFGNPSGIYGEAAFRLAFSFVEIFLTTEPTEPSGARDAEVSKHAWYLPDVRPLDRVYLGFGYTF